MKLSKCWSIIRNNNINQQQWLNPDYKIEVYQHDINQSYSAYEMVIHAVDHSERTVQVFYHDDPKHILYTVSYRYIAPITYRMIGAEYSVGTLVEVYYRVDDESPWGWWSAVVTECLDTEYVVQYLDNELATVSRLNVRAAIFN